MPASPPPASIAAPAGLPPPLAAIVATQTASTSAPATQTATLI